MTGMGDRLVLVPMSTPGVYHLLATDEVNT